MNYATTPQATAVKQLLKIKEVRRKNLQSISYIRQEGILRDNARVLDVEYENLKTEMTRLRNIVRKFIERKTLEDLIAISSDNRVKKNLVFEVKIMDRIRKSGENARISTEELETAALMAAKFHNDIKIL